MRNTESEDQELKRLNYITDRIIGCAIEVHRSLGPGLLEHTYEEAMCLEMDRRRMNFRRQSLHPVKYKGTEISQQRIDLIVEDAVVVELKSVERLDSVYTAQVLTYLRCTGLRLGLLINFNGRLLRTGIRRYIL
jgi:GxxExxY protein